MLKREGNYFLNLLKATRIERALMPVSFIMIAPAFTNKISVDIFLLMICCTLMYMVGGLINAKLDKDFNATKITLTIIILFSISIIISLQNKIIFFTVLASLAMGLIYSKLSRFILFGDAITLSITHAAIPIISSSIIIGLNIQLTLIIITLVLPPFIFITPMKNLNGIEEDKKRNYATLMTKYKNGKTATHILLSLYFLAVFLIYFLTDLGNKFLFIVFLMFIIKIFMDYYMNINQELIAYALVRLVIIILPFAFVFDQAKKIELILISSSFVLVYLTYFILKVGEIKHGKSI